MIVNKAATLPCVEEKCICYPICISKEAIECEYLTVHYGVLTNGKYQSGAEKAWDRLRTTFPKLREIHGPLLRHCGLKYRAYAIYKYPPEEELWDGR